MTTPRPVVLCRGACEILEDGLGNDVTVVGLALQRLLRVPGLPVEARRWVVLARARLDLLEARYRGLTPCDRCPGCGKGAIVDVEA